MSTIEPPSPRRPPAATAQARDAGRTVVRLHSPGDLLAVLPYQLGYVPERSLLVLALRGTSLFFVGRVDLPPRSASGREAAAAVLAPMSRHRFDRALVVTVETALVAGTGLDGRAGHADGSGAAPRSWTDLARAVCSGLRAQGAQVDARITVRDGLWWCPDGTARERRPQPVPAPGDVPAVAEYVGRGRVPLRHRDDLVSLVRSAPGAGGAAAEVDDLVGRFAGGGAERRDLRRAAVAAWARFVVAERPPGGGAGPDLPLLVASLSDVPLRDLVLFWLCPQRPADTDASEAADQADPDDPSDPSDPSDPELAELARTLRDGAGPPDGTADGTADGTPDPGSGHLVAALTRLSRSCPPGHAVPVLGVLAHVAWWHGDGTLARVAVDAALAQDPGYSLALLLSQLLDLAVAPRDVA